MGFGKIKKKGQLILALNITVRTRSLQDTKIRSTGLNAQGLLS